MQVQVPKHVLLFGAIIGSVLTFGLAVEAMVGFLDLMKQVIKGLYLPMLGAEFLFLVCGSGAYVMHRARKRSNIHWATNLAAVATQYLLGYLSIAMAIGSLVHLMELNRVAAYIVFFTALPVLLARALQAYLASLRPETA